MAVRSTWRRACQDLDFGERVARRRVRLGSDWLVSIKRSCRRSTERSCCRSESRNPSQRGSSCRRQQPTRIFIWSPQDVDSIAAGLVSLACCELEAQTRDFRPEVSIAGTEVGVSDPATESMMDALRPETRLQGSKGQVHEPCDAVRVPSADGVDVKRA